MKKRFIELELVLFLLVLFITLVAVYGLNLSADILFQTRQDPTRIILMIMVLFVVSSVWVIAELLVIINEHHAIGRIVGRLANFITLELDAKERRTWFGSVLIGIKTAHQQNPLHDIDYRAEISEVVAAIDTRHATIRFASRVAQYLGVIGTMLGLIIALGVLFRDLSVEQQDVQAQILTAIKNSMGGMYAAYANSVAGMVLGSLLLTFGTMLLRNSLEKFAFRLSIICRRLIAPQLALANIPQDADAKSFELVVRGLQGVIEQLRHMSAAHDAQTKAIKENSQQFEQMLKQQSTMQQQVGILGPLIERLAIFASRVMGMPAEPPKPREK